MNAAAFYKIADEKGISILKIAEIIGKSEVTTLRKICNGGFNRSCRTSLTRLRSRIQSMQTVNSFMRQKPSAWSL